MSNSKMSSFYLEELCKKTTYTDLEFSDELNPMPDENGMIDEDIVIAYHYFGKRIDGLRVEISVEIDSDTETPVWELEDDDADWEYICDLNDEDEADILLFVVSQEGL